MAERIHGVNLSGWFIPETWVSPSLFAATGAANAVELQRALGPAVYSERLRHHFETFITEDDFRRIAAKIPAIDYVDRAIERAEKNKLSVLLSLATVPGGQGDSNESPTTPESTADWHSSKNGRHVALTTLEKLAARYGSAASLLGIELLDSPVVSVRKNIFTMTDGIPAHYLRNFYRDAYALMRAHMPEEKAIVFSASGHPDLWKGFMRGGKYKNVVMDLHLYHYRDESACDITSPKGISQAIARNRKLLREATSTGFPILVGEWSAAAVLSSASMTPEGRAAYERVFVSSQLASFDTAWGWYFQTWKTEKRIPAWDARVALAPLERAMID